MDASHHRFSELFAQLGLPNDTASIASFVHEHRLHAGQSLCDAPFWTPAQAAMLRESWQADGDWAEVVDQLNAALQA